MKDKSYLTKCGRASRSLALSGFTLVELLAVVACLGVLVALGIGAAQATLSSGNKVREINAAKNLISAYMAAAADDNGRFMPGIDMRANASSNPVYKSDGSVVTNARAAQRYPFRLSPYLNDQFNGTILVNKNIKKIQQATGGAGSNYDYYVSTFPALGLNVYCVGGVVLNNGTTMYAEDCITTMGRAKGSIVAFASAGQGAGSGKTDGYCYVTPPTLSSDSPLCLEWNNVGSWKSTVDPMNYGYVDCRYDDKAVCAFLDGSVRMMSIEELHDMRLWNPTAASEDNRNFRMSH